MLAQILFLATVTLAAFTDTLNNNFTFSASINDDGVTATVCMSGNVSENTYIAIGIPRDPSVPYMAGADITIAYGNSSAQYGIVTLLHGHGRAMDRPFFQEEVNNTESILARDMSYYVDGYLQACFERPIQISQNVGWDLSTGLSGYIWGSGKVYNGIPFYHWHNRGFVTNASLFDVWF